jgi:hypothetical protein
MEPRNENFVAEKIATLLSLGKIQIRITFTQVPPPKRAEEVLTPRETPQERDEGVTSDDEESSVSSGPSDEEEEDLSVFEYAFQLPVEGNVFSPSPDSDDEGNGLPREKDDEDDDSLPDPRKVFCCVWRKGKTVRDSLGLATKPPSLFEIWEFCKGKPYSSSASRGCYIPSKVILAKPSHTDAFDGPPRDFPSLEKSVEYYVDQSTRAIHRTPEASYHFSVANLRKLRYEMEEQEKKTETRETDNIDRAKSGPLITFDDGILTDHSQFIYDPESGAIFGIRHAGNPRKYSAGDVKAFRETKVFYHDVAMGRKKLLSEEEFQRILRRVRERIAVKRNQEALAGR